MADPVEPRSAVEEAHVAAHTIALPRGTYCIYVIEVSAGVPPSQLPGLGVSPAPGEEGAAVEVARLAGEPWLRRHGDAVLVRVHAPRVRLLLTSYNLARTRGAAPPKIEVQRLDEPAGKPAADPVPSRPNGKPQTGAPTAELVVHVRHRGDLRGPLGEWLGEPGGERWVEGFTIPPLPGFAPDALQYQAVFGKDWLSPWVNAGEYCGSRGMQLAILGLRVRLGDAAAKRWRVALSAAFGDGNTVGPVQAGQICAAEPLQPVTALRIDLAQIPARAATDKTAPNGHAHNAAPQRPASPHSPSTPPSPAAHTPVTKPERPLRGRGAGAF